MQRAHDEFGAERQGDEQAESSRGWPTTGKIAERDARSRRAAARRLAPPALVTAAMPASRSPKRQSPGPTLRRALGPPFSRRHTPPPSRSPRDDHAGRVGTLSGGASGSPGIVLRPHLPASELAVASRSLRPRSQRRVRAVLHRLPSGGPRGHLQALRREQRATPRRSSGAPADATARRAIGDARREAVPRATSSPSPGPPTPCAHEGNRNAEANHGAGTVRSSAR